LRESEKSHTQDLVYEIAQVESLGFGKWVRSGRHFGLRRDVVEDGRKRVDEEEREGGRLAGSAQ